MTTFRISLDVRVQAQSAPKASEFAEYLADQLRSIDAVDRVDIDYVDDDDCDDEDEDDDLDQPASTVLLPCRHCGASESIHEPFLGTCPDLGGTVYDAVDGIEEPSSTPPVEG